MGQGILVRSASLCVTSIMEFPGSRPRGDFHAHATLSVIIFFFLKNKMHGGVSFTRKKSQRGFYWRASDHTCAIWLPFSPSSSSFGIFRAPIFYLSPRGLTFIVPEKMFHGGGGGQLWFFYLSGLILFIARVFGGLMSWFYDPSHLLRSTVQVDLLEIFDASIFLTPYTSLCFCSVRVNALDYMTFRFSDFNGSKPLHFLGVQSRANFFYLEFSFIFQTFVHIVKFKYASMHWNAKFLSKASNFL